MTLPDPDRCRRAAESLRLLCVPQDWRSFVFQSDQRVNGLDFLISASAPPGGGRVLVSAGHAMATGVSVARKSGTRLDVIYHATGRWGGRVAMIGDLEIRAARCIADLKAGKSPRPEDMAAAAEVQRLECNRNCMPQVWALIAAGWTIEWPERDCDSEPWQWAFRAPPKRPGKPGRRYLSTGQAYNAMLREQKQ